MLTRLTVRGFKSLRAVDVELGRLSVLVGGNGTGKTSTLEAIRFLADALRPKERTIAVQLPLYRASLDRLRTRGHAGGVDIVAEFTAAGASGRIDAGFEDRSYAVSVHGEGLGQRLRVKSTPRTDMTPGNYVDLEVMGGLPTPVLRFAEGVGMYGLDAKSMARPSYSLEAEPRLGYDGGNLATVLSALAGSGRDRFDAIEDDLRSFIPGLRRLKVKRVQMSVLDSKSEPREVVGDQVVFDFDRAADVAAEDASEGTLLLLGLLTVVESSSAPDVTLMLDDLDRALHPQAQAKLVEYLHRLSIARPGLQFIATTHSPYLVEHLAFDEVLATTIDGERGTVIQPLDRHPDAERWREEMSAGEFWSSVGESWVARGA